MPLALTTVERIRELHPSAKANEGNDPRLSALILRVSRQIERELGLEFEKVERTELLDVAYGQTLFHLKAMPVDTAEDFIVKNEANGDFAAAAAIDSDNYHVDAARGRLQFRGRYYSLVDGPGCLQVVYTGGIAEDGDDVLAIAPDYADLVLACEMQVWHEMQRAPNWGSPGRTVGGGGQTFDEDEVYGSAFTPRVSKILQLYRRGAGVV